MSVVILSNIRRMGMVFILLIRRKKWNLSIQHVYFAERPATVRRSMNIVRHVHSLVPSRKLAKSETVHIDLLKNEEELYASLSKKYQLIIRRAKKEPYAVFVFDQPTEQQLLQFQRFYNLFAKQKKIPTIGRSELKIMKLLAQNKALLLSELQNENGQTLCSRVDIIHGKKAMSYYAASNLSNQWERQIRYASRYLLWHNLQYLKRDHFEIYDTGGLTDNASIEDRTLEFGGQIVEVYSGTITQSKISALLLGVEKWRERKSK